MRRLRPDPPRDGGRGRVARALHLPALGLRARVTALFALGALAVSGILAVVLFFATRQILLDQQLASYRSQAYANALIVRSTLANNPNSVYNTLGALNQPAADAVLFFHGSWYGTWWLGGTPSEQLAEERIPANLLLAVGGAQAAEETYQSRGSARFAIGVPIGEVDAVYFEDFDMSSMQDTLRRLFAALAVAALATTLAGAVTGRWAAGRALRPLRGVADAARAIAGGQLETRLETGDVSDLAVLASSFNRMVDRLQERIEREERFTSDVSHELRSPLTTLSASLSVLEARVDEMPERAQRAVELAGAEIRRFQRMVSDLLEISRLDAGSVDLVLEEVSVGELVRRTAMTGLAAISGPDRAGLTPPAGDRGDGELPGFPVLVDPSVENRHVLVDKRRFERVVANLVENAWLYGGGVTSITVEGRAGSIRLTVEDSGPGIPSEERERIFERFSHGSSARRRGSSDGTGLGLALVSEHVRLHGGRVWVESSEGQGARFVVELPAAPEDGEGTPEEEPA